MMNFEDLPKHVQEQLREEMLHEEPGQREAAEQELTRLQAEAEAQGAKPTTLQDLAAAFAESPNDAQQRFDRAQAEAAGVPLDFVQLYNKVEAEIDAFAEGKQGKEVVAAAVIQLVSHYCAAATEGRLRDQGEEIEKLNRTLSKQATWMHNEREIYKRRGRDLDVMRAVVAGTMELARCSEYDVTDERVARLGKIVTVWPMPEVRKTRIKIEDTHD
ncbi:hypothetical protein MARTHA_45 [Arthrobacter phage Martha]|uniref:Uncharacterized protein n=1 Tax=Arthrobacter phage Martha TaxID=1772307 RepID=A0A0U4JZQ5_9CAUD|nr:hypothetical protein FDH49_gp45 [Arthrobacter phage Martha]ALY09698.1 hypothetical protein MARTHA_45 [Arthrobacter phage Martha]